MTTRIIMRNDGRATAEGETEIFGTNGAQTVTVLDGATVTFRSGFNTGGDTIRINGRASDFTVSISGSNVTFRSNVDNITVVIPIGTAANTITFDNGDSRSLSLVGGVPTLGTQAITAAGVAVTAGPGTFTITGAGSANEGGVITYTVTRTDTTAAQTLLFSVDGSTNGGVVAAATQGADFSPASGAITFAAGAATATFTVAVSTDATVEGLEGISVRVLNGSTVVASTNATIIDGQSQGQGTPLTAGVDNVVGTGGNDTVTGRLSEFSSLDTVTGGAGIDTLVLTGVLPSDFQPQPPAVLDAAFERTSGIERLVLTGGTLAQSVNATLGTLAAASGLTEVVAGGTGGQAQIIDIQAFTNALLVTGSGNAETVNVNLGTTGAKTLNLGAGNDTVNVTPVSAVAGSVQVNFDGALVGNGTNNDVTIVSANGNVIVNDESTVIQATNAASVFNVAALGATANFGRIELGTGAGEVFTTINTGDQIVGSVPPAFLTAAQALVSTYFNGGAGNDTFNVTAEAGERHFAVGGIGNDTLTAWTNSATGVVSALLGEGTDTVTVNNNQGLVDINLGDGDDTITFTAEFTPNLAGAAATRDVVNGGAGRDTLVATSFWLTQANNTVVGAVQSVSGIEVLTVTDVLANNLTTGLIQAGIDTVNLNAGVFFSTVTFDSGLASTLNLAASAGLSGIRVASAGTGTADQVTIANTAAAVGGVAQNAFNGQTITTTGVETLIINTSAAGSATTQTIGGINAGFTTAVPPVPIAVQTVNFVGSNSVNAGVVEARTVNASGLTGTAGITATTVTTDNAANAFTGSAGNDTVTLGAGRQNLNLGAGNDTVVINAINALGTGTSRLAGGEGTDTLRMGTADAAQLSVTNIFNANNSGFEVLSLARQAQGPANGPGVVETIRIDNIGTAVNRVISEGTADGTPGTGRAEVVTFTAPTLNAGQSITVSQPGGAPAVTYTNTTNVAQSAATVANGIAALFNGANAPGTLDAQFNATSVGGVVTLTGTAFLNVLDLTVAVNNVAVAGPTFTTVQGVNPIAATPEVANLILDASNGSTPATFTARPFTNNTITFNGQAGASFDLVSAADLSGVTPELAQAIKTAADADADWSAQYTTTVVGNNIRFTAITTGPTTDVTISDPTGGFRLADGLLVNEELNITQGTPLIPGTAEVTTVTWQPLLQGQSVTVAGRTVTATTQNLTAQQVADAYEAGQNGLIVTIPAFADAQVSGTLVGWTLGAGAATTTVFTSTAAADLTQTQNVADLNLSQVLTAAPLAPNPTVNNVAGEAPGLIGPAGTLIIQNLDSNGTLEITRSSSGTHEVRVTDSGLNLNDVLNLELTNIANVVGFNSYGTIKVDNVETLNITTRDTGTGAGTAASVEVINFLDAAQVTSVTVSGNNGLNIGANHNLTGLTTFNASLVIGNAGDLRADLGVFFQSLNTSATATVTFTGGIGNDDFIGNVGTDIYNLGTGNGGSDLVQFAATRAANGQDTINGFTGGTGAGGDVLDLNGIFGVTAFDGNGASAGLVFNATGTNTGDLVLAGNNQNVYLVSDGAATINLANIKDFTAATALTGEILLTDGASAYVLHATSTGSNTFTVLRVFDGNGVGGTVDVRTEVLGTVNLTNTFGELVSQNFDQTWAPLVQPALTAAEVAAATPPAPAPLIGMLDGVDSFSIV